jgi:hypothetical protein
MTPQWHCGTHKEMRILTRDLPFDLICRISESKFYVDNK